MYHKLFTRCILSRRRPSEDCCHIYCRRWLELRWNNKTCCLLRFSDLYRCHVVVIEWHDDTWMRGTIVNKVVTFENYDGLRDVLGWRLPHSNQGHGCYGRSHPQWKLLCIVTIFSKAHRNSGYMDHWHWREGLTRLASVAHAVLHRCFGPDECCDVGAWLTWASFSHLNIRIDVIVRGFLHSISKPG